MTQAEFETSLMLLGFSKIIISNSKRCKGNWRADTHRLYTEVFDDCAKIIRLYTIISNDTYSLIATDHNPSKMLNVILDRIENPR